jgi:hypothetical protein
MIDSPSPEPSASHFDERSPSRIIKDRATQKRPKVLAPLILQRCSALALMGVAGFGIALILAVTEAGSGQFALIAMVVSTLAILSSMVVATTVSTRSAHSNDTRLPS